MAENDYRIAKLREYLFGIINTLTEDRSYNINVDYLGDVNNFSLDKIPTETTVETYITGGALYKDVYNFRSRKTYSMEWLNNLENIGFFEDFERKIKTNNNAGILPDINGIENIKCLNCGTLNTGDETEAIFDIQIQITYEEDEEDARVSN